MIGCDDDVVKTQLDQFRAHRARRLPPALAVDTAPRDWRLSWLAISPYIVATLLSCTDLVQACENGAREACDRTADPTLGSQTVVTMFPAGDVFPVYVADPQRPTNALLIRFNSSRGIPATTARRTGLAAGGRFGFVRVESGGESQRSWQFSQDAGLDALFESDRTDSVIGWDGNYGLTFTTASNGPWSLKVAALHNSAHLGDEYEDEMHRQRIDYTREEIAVGVGWRPAVRWRIYGEAAHSYHLSNPLQAPWRLQQGVEYESRPTLFGGRFAWYGGLDLQSM